MMHPVRSRSRRILSSTSASGLLRKLCLPSVSSPMAKYTSCVRAHGSQKDTPRISTTALREQWASALMPTWQDPGFVVTSVKETPVRNLLDRLFEGVARAEGGNLLGRDLHLLARLGVPALPGLALLDGELAEASDLDLLAGLERFGHYLLEGLELLLCLALGHPSFLCDPLDGFLLLHGCSFLVPFLVLRRSCLGTSVLFVREELWLLTPRYRRVCRNAPPRGCGAAHTPH